MFLLIKYRGLLKAKNIFIIKKYPYALVIGNEQRTIKFLNDKKANILKYQILYESHNAKYPLLDIAKINARIEPGAIIRDGVTIEANAIILMGAVVNIGAFIGQNTMVDMNAVIGSKAIIKQNCHIGAGAVIAGVLEPESSKPVIIDNGVLIGANATILNGVHIGENAIVGAGSVVTKDVLPNTTVVGIPARPHNSHSGWKLNESLR